jgi:sulfatase maturation enzyme AslB (radical SAM superfamily)
VSIVGGEPLVRYRELNEILPRLANRGIFTQVVTSAVRPIPTEWSSIQNLDLSVSIDGLRPEHDARRAPATYDRILKHIDGHHVTVHCTVTRQQTLRRGYLQEFVAFWSAQPAVRRIWVSLYTPQVGEVSAERLTDPDRQRVVSDLLSLRARFPKLDMPAALVEVYGKPPASPTSCIFAKTTTCISADLETRIGPCQFGGNPDCTECGCVASAGLAAIGRHRLPGGLRVESLFRASDAVGSTVGTLRTAFARPRPRGPSDNAATRRAEVEEGSS